MCQCYIKICKLETSDVSRKQRPSVTFLAKSLQIVVLLCYIIPRQLYRGILDSTIYIFISLWYICRTSNKIDLMWFNVASAHKIRHADSNLSRNIKKYIQLH